MYRLNASDYDGLLTRKLSLRASRLCFSMIRCAARSSAVKFRIRFFPLALSASLGGLSDWLPRAMMEEAFDSCCSSTVLDCDYLIRWIMPINRKGLMGCQGLVARRRQHQAFISSEEGAGVAGRDCPGLVGGCSIVGYFFDWSCGENQLWWVVAATGLL